MHRLERTIGEPVEAAVRTDTYFDVVTKVNRVKRKAGGVLEGAVAARVAHAQPARRHATSAGCASSSRGWSAGSTS